MAIATDLYTNIARSGGSLPVPAREIVQMGMERLGDFLERECAYAHSRLLEARIVAADLHKAVDLLEMTDRNIPGTPVLWRDERDEQGNRADDSWHHGVLIGHHGDAIQVIERYRHGWIWLDSSEVEFQHDDEGLEAMLNYPGLASYWD